MDLFFTAMDGAFGGPYFFEMCATVCNRVTSVSSVTALVASVALKPRRIPGIRFGTGWTGRHR